MTDQLFNDPVMTRGISLPKSLNEALREQARLEDRPASRIIKRALILYLKQGNLLTQRDALRAELCLIVEGWDAIESNEIRTLSDWEKQCRECARTVLAGAEGADALLAGGEKGEIASSLRSSQ